MLYNNVILFGRNTIFEYFDSADMALGVICNCWLCCYDVSPCVLPQVLIPDKSATFLCLYHYFRNYYNYLKLPAFCTTYMNALLLLGWPSSHPCEDMQIRESTTTTTTTSFPHTMQNKLNAKWHFSKQLDYTLQIKR